MDRKRFAGLALQRPEAPDSPCITTHSFKEKGPACLGEQTGLLRSIHAPIMCRLTKAEAASKSLMQNLCSCGCFSGWKNQYCGSDARRWLSALWLTVKAKRDWGAAFTVLEMERSTVCLIVEFTFNFDSTGAYFSSSEDFKTFKTPLEMEKKVRSRPACNKIIKVLLALWFPSC